MVRLPVLLQNCFFSEGGGYDASGPSFNLTRVTVFLGAYVLRRASDKLGPSFVEVCCPASGRPCRLCAPGAAGIWPGHHAGSWPSDRVDRVLRDAKRGRHGAVGATRLYPRRSRWCEQSSRPSPSLGDRQNGIGVTSYQKWDTPMITPQQTDLGRRVVYRPPGVGRRYGVISAIYTGACSSGSITSTRTEAQRRREGRDAAIHHEELRFAEQHSRTSCSRRRKISSESSRHEAPNFRWQSRSGVVSVFESLASEFLWSLVFEIWR